VQVVISPEGRSPRLKSAANECVVVAAMPKKRHSKSHGFPMCRVLVANPNRWQWGFVSHNVVRSSSLSRYDSEAALPNNLLDDSSPLAVVFRLPGGPASCTHATRWTDDCLKQSHFGPAKLGVCPMNRRTVQGGRARILYLGGDLIGNCDSPRQRRGPFLGGLRRPPSRQIYRRNIVRPASLSGLTDYLTEVSSIRFLV